jgi:hypothetical protein
MSIMPTQKAARAQSRPQPERKAKPDGDAHRADRQFQRSRQSFEDQRQGRRRKNERAPEIAGCGILQEQQVLAP